MLRVLESVSQKEDQSELSFGQEKNMWLAGDVEHLSHQLSVLNSSFELIN